MDLINELVAIHGYRSYLEICTYTTGRLYADLDRGRFTISHRLMYRCPESFDDGLPIDFRSASSEIATQLTALRASGVTYDLILVDPFHDYEQSRRHLRAARSLLTAKGTIVVHDCRPPDRELASPEFLAGAWCGVTYKAYLDFMLEAGDLQFCTVDVDHGCGIIRRRCLLRGRASLIACAGPRRLLRRPRLSSLPAPGAPSWRRGSRSAMTTRRPSAWSRPIRNRC